MVGKLLLRGLLAGLIAGIVAFGFAYVYGEPSVDAAITFEEQMAAAEPGAGAGAEEAPPTITRDTQKSIGLLTGIAVLGVGLGGLYSVLFGFANGRIGKLGNRPTALLLAAVCFVTFVLVPWLKYPASPPASTFDDTIGFRTSLYFLMLALSIALTVCAWIVRLQLLPRLGNWNASVATVVGYVVVLLLLGSLMPTVNEVPQGFPASVMWDFRVASLGIQAILWSALGLIFGLLVDRTMPELSRSRLAPAR
jgi:hypothetical protein